MEESSRVKTLIRSYVVDDGWHLPKEIIETIDIRIAEAKLGALKRVRAEHDRHKGKWLNAEAVRKYQAKSWVFPHIDEQWICDSVVEDYLCAAM